MLLRAMVLVILLAARLRAVDSDFRSGLWEGTIERGRGVERVVLLLTISVEAVDGPNVPTTATARVESNAGVCGSNQPELEPNRVSFECTPIGTQGEPEAATGHFEGHFSPRSNLVTGTWRSEPIQLTRPKQTDSLTSEGDWVAESSGQTCVVRFFYGNRTLAGMSATIDIYSKERAVFGRLIGVVASPGPQYRLNFGWADKDKNMFFGKLNADKGELTGIWQGRDFLCGGPDQKITFQRIQSSL
jgi:hypothetical protein